MARRPASHYGVAPRERPPARPPEERAVAATPKGTRWRVARAPAIARAPKEHHVGKPPNPRTPRLVRDVDGGRLNDLFAFFPICRGLVARPRISVESGRSRRPARRRVRSGAECAKLRGYVVRRPDPRWPPLRSSAPSHVSEGVRSGQGSRRLRRTP